MLSVGRAIAQENKGRPAGPVYVPLDSWVYPALKRLAALGYISNQYSDAGPWTRTECRRQVAEATAAVTARALNGASAADTEALRLLADLKQEFAEASGGSRELRLESLYMQTTGISGSPLRDSYHFGQTITDNFGRPYGAGINEDAGFSGYATDGRFSAYVRAEYQQSPGESAYPAAVQSFVNSVDEVPNQAASPAGAAHRFEPLEMYVGAQLGFENITFGQQSLWWGAGSESAFAFSNNAAPFYMVRFDQSDPLHLPWNVSRFAKMRTQIIFGQLDGHHWPAHPYVNAQKFTIDLPGDLEVGFTRSAFFGGAGRPLTLSSFAQSLFSGSSVDYGPYGSPDAPGDRHSDFDFRWRVPGVDHLLTIYSDSYADDEPNPIDNPKRSAWGPGMYLSRVPGLAHLDLRFETYSTWLYRKDQGGRFLYWDNQYRDSYTNDGNLLGSWVGRDSRAYVALTNYWFSAKTRLQAQYKQIKASPKFLPAGGTQTDVGVTAQWAPTREWLFGLQAQGERYWIPELGGPRKDLVLALQIAFMPSNWAVHR